MTVPRWSVPYAQAFAAAIGMPPGSEWAMVWTVRPVRGTGPGTIFFKRASDPEAGGHQFKLTFDELRPMEGFTFEMFGRLSDTPSTPLYWQFEPSGGLTTRLLVEVWCLEVPLGRGLRALRTYDPRTDEDRRAVEITGPEWEGAIDRAKRGLRALDMIVSGSGGRHKTPRDLKIDKIAEAGLKWHDANHRAGRFVTVEDFGRPEMGEATGRGLKGVNDHMNRKPTVYNDDVWDRMRELLAARESAR